MLASFLPMVMIKMMEIMRMMEMMEVEAMDMRGFSVMEAFLLCWLPFFLW